MITHIYKHKNIDLKKLKGSYEHFLQRAEIYLHLHMAHCSHRAIQTEAGRLGKNTSWDDGKKGYFEVCVDIHIEIIQVSA